MAEIQDWQILLSNIIDYTGAHEGYVFIEIKEIPHNLWENMPGVIHTFTDQKPKYVKEFKPILNLTIKLGCRCAEHNQEPKSPESNYELLTPEQQEDFKNWLVNRGFEYP